MKKIKIFLLLLVVGIFLPFGVNAASRKNVYIFKGDGCPHCEEALEFFQDLINDKDYTDKFDLVEYEVWKNKDNASFADVVAKELGEEMDGVPYIIIGDESFSGFSSSMSNQIKDAIDEFYNDDEATSVVERLNGSGEYNVTPESTIERTGDKGNADTIIAIVIIAIAVGGFGYVVYLSRKDTTSKYYEKPVKKEKAEVEEVKEEKVSVKNTNNTKKTTTKGKKTNNKKSSTKKK